MDKATQSRLVRLGALTEKAQLEVRLKELDRIIRSNGPSALSPVKRRRQKKMSAAARKAVSARMKKYWAERRASK